MISAHWFGLLNNEMKAILQFWEFLSNFNVLVNDYGHSEGKLDKKKKYCVCFYTKN